MEILVLQFAQRISLKLTMKLQALACGMRWRIFKKTVCPVKRLSIDVLSAQTTTTLTMLPLSICLTITAFNAKPTLPSELQMRTSKSKQSHIPMTIILIQAETVTSQLAQWSTVQSQQMTELHVIHVGDSHIQIQSQLLLDGSLILLLMNIFFSSIKKTQVLSTWANFTTQSMCSGTSN